MSEWEDSKDFISRKDAIDKLEEWSGGYSYIEIDTLGALVEFEKLPSADVVEVVRCKDCKHYTSVTAKCDIRGKGLNLIRGEEDFCSRAERRTE